MTIDQAVLLVQQGGNLGDVILNPPQPRVSINLPLPVVVPGSQRGACTRADLDGRKDLIHYELKDIDTGTLQGLKVVLHRSTDDECVGGAVHPTCPRSGGMGPVKSRSDFIRVKLTTKKLTHLAAIFVSHVSGKTIVSRSHVECVIKSNAPPIARTVCVFRNVIFDQKIRDSWIVLLSQTH